MPLPWALEESVVPFAAGAVCGLENLDRVARVLEGTVVVDMSGVGVVAAGPAAHSPALAPFFD